MGEADFKVVVAGGGVAAAEAALALHELAHSRIDLELIAPNDQLVLPALAVAEPFGMDPPPALPLADLCRDSGAVQRRDTVDGVDPAARSVSTGAGAEVPFDALLLAVGASAEPALTGALTYRGPRDNGAIRDLLLEAEEAEVERIAFAIPTSIQWPLPIYELALLTAHDLRRRGTKTRLSLVTDESSPLALFGRRASEAVGELLAEEGVELVTNARAAGVQAGGLALHDGRVIPADRVVASPRLSVAPIEGIPQGPDGFVGTDTAMRVEGTPRVYAAGDATWFPIKQGGVAAQQADTAASIDRLPRGPGGGGGTVPAYAARDPLHRGSPSLPARGDRPPRDKLRGEHGTALVAARQGCGEASSSLSGQAGAGRVADGPRTPPWRRSGGGRTGSARSPRAGPGRRRCGRPLAGLPGRPSLAGSRTGAQYRAAGGVCGETA